MRARLKSFRYERGYGFFATDEGRDIFVHINTFHDCDLSEPRVNAWYEIETKPSTRYKGKFEVTKIAQLDDVEADKEEAWWSRTASLVAGSAKAK